MIVTISDIQKAPSVADFVLKTVEEWKGCKKLSEINDNKKYYLGTNPVLNQQWNQINLDTGGVLELKPRQNIYSNFFGRIVKQLVNRLLYYDVSFDDDVTLLKMGNKFHQSLRDIAFDAAVSGVSWGFWQNGKLVHFPSDGFIPIYNDRNGKIEKGIKFWQVREDLPTFYQLFEVDGITEWQSEKDANILTLVKDKTPYRYQIRAWQTGRRDVVNIQNYGVLPIIPMYPNMERRSELTKPIQTKINAYDLLNTFYTDEFLQSKFVYWMITGFQGNAEELIKIRDIVRKLGIIANTDEQSKITTQTLEPPHNAQEKIMKQLVREIFRDAMVFNTEEITTIGTTATAVKASQYSEDIKVRGFEHNAEVFIRGIMDLAGVESRAVSFTHFRLLDEESITRRLVMLYNMGIPIEEIIKHEPLLQDRAAEIEDLIANRDLGIGGVHGRTDTRANAHA